MSPETLPVEERRKRLIKRLSSIVEIIRKHGEISIVDLSVEAGYSLKTLKYEILQQIMSIFRDIKIIGDKVVSVSEEGGKSEAEQH